MSKMTKTEKALEAMRTTSRNAKERLASEKGELLRTGAVFAGGFVLGTQQANGNMDRLPDAGPLPKVIYPALVLKGGALVFKKGSLWKEGVNGLGDAAVALLGQSAAFGTRTRISGTIGAGSGGGSEMDRVRQMEERLANERRGSGDALEGALAGRDR